MIVTAVLVVAIAACAAGGIALSRRVRLADYTSFRSRGSFGTILLSLLASLVGGWMFFGLSAIGYEAGVLGFVIGLGYAVGLVLVGLLVPRIKRAMESANADTMDDLVGARYGKAAQAVVSVINLTFFLAVLAAQFLAMAAFLSLFVLVQREFLFFGATAAVILYTSLAGFKGVLITDVWQFWVIAATVLVVFAVLAFGADWQAVRSLDPEYFRATGYGVGFLVGALVFLPFVQLVRTDLWQRIACAKDVKSVQRAFYVCAPILLVFYVLMTTVGICARAGLGEGTQADTSGLVLFLSRVGFSGEQEPSVAAQLMVVVLSLGVFAALLSTVDTNLSVVAVAVSKLLRRREWLRFEEETKDKIHGPRTPLEERLLRTSRLVTLVLGILGLAVAWAVPDIVALIVAAASMLLVFAPAVLATVLWGSRRAVAATTSIILGYLTFLGLFVFSNPKTAFLPGVAVAFVSYGVLRFVSKDSRKAN